MRERRSAMCRAKLFLISACAVVFAAAALALAQSGNGQAPSGPAGDAAVKADTSSSAGSTQTVAGIRIQSNLVTAPVTVTNKITGDFVYDLQQNDFQILDNGRPQKITGFAREPHKIAAVILIQDNEAVGPLLKELRQLGPIFSQLMLGPNGQAAVITFASTVRVEQGFSNSEADLDKVFMTLSTDGPKARLNDALVQAMNLLEHRPQDERRVIIVFSNGYDSGSETSNDDVIRRAAASEVEIYGVGLSLTKSYLSRDLQPMNAPTTPENSSVAIPPVPGVPSTPSSSMQRSGVMVPGTGAVHAAVRGVQSKFQANNLESYARYTGGVFYSQWSAKALQVHLSEIAADIHSQYLLAYVPDDLSQRGFHRLEIKVRKDGVNVRTRRGYFYVGQKQ